MKNILDWILKNYTSKDIEKTIVFILVVTASIWGWYNIPKLLLWSGWNEEWSFGSDFRIYYEAGKGNFDWVRTVDYHGLNHPGWLYPRWTAYFWAPFTLMSFKNAFLVWYCLMVFSYLALSNKILKYDHGWIVSTVCIIPLLVSLSNGNILPLLAVAMLTPAGCIFAGVFKCWPVLILFVHLAIYLRNKNPLTKKEYRQALIYWGLYFGIGLILILLFVFYWGIPSRVNANPLSFLTRNTDMVILPLVFIFLGYWISKKCFFILSTACAALLVYFMCYDYIRLVVKHLMLQK